MRANAVSVCALGLAGVLGILVAVRPMGAAEDPPAPEPKVVLSEAVLEKALTKPVEWNFQATPLVKVVEQVQKTLEVPVLLDRRSLEEQGIALDTPVTWSIPRLTAEAALQCILREHSLTLALRNEVLLITTPEQESAQLRTVVYDVAALLSPEEPQADDEEESAANDDKTTDEKASKAHRNKQSDYYLTCGVGALLRAIEALSPSTWEEVGGTGSDRVLYVKESPRLIVLQTQEIHQSIARLLTTLRHMQRDPSLQIVEVASEAQQRAEKAIRQQLRKRVDVVFRETSLSNVVAWFGKTLEVPVALDQRALAEVGIACDTPVTLELHGVTAQTALERVLEPQQLTWTIGPEVLRITTPEQAAETLATRVYNIADLSQQSYGTQKPGERCQEVAEAIQATIAPSTWEEVGGAGETVVYRGPDLTVLVVRQTVQVHDEIEALLRQLRTGASEGTE